MEDNKSNKEFWKKVKVNFTKEEIASGGRPLTFMPPSLTPEQAKKLVKAWTEMTPKALLYDKGLVNELVVFGTAGEVPNYVAGVDPFDIEVNEPEVVSTVEKVKPYQEHFMELNTLFNELDMLKEKFIGDKKIVLLKSRRIGYSPNPLFNNGQKEILDKMEEIKNKISEVYGPK